MNQATSTNEIIVRCNHVNNNDEDDEESSSNLENKDPCALGTPVCLPAVVWFEDSQGTVANHICINQASFLENNSSDLMNYGCVILFLIFNCY